MTATHIGWSADATGYTVTVYGPEDVELHSYSAGNSPFDSQGYLPADSRERLPVRTIRKYAKQTAGEIALEYGVPADMIQEDDRASE